MKIIITTAVLIFCWLPFVQSAAGQAKQLKDTATSINAYPFELKGYDGKKYTLNDFRGKVIVCKFWILGCSPCAYIEKIMRPLKEKYKELDVVFLSVFAGSERSKWQKGLEEHKYTSDADLQLTTDGMQHPMLKFYGYTGFPQILLIDKRGKLISSRGVRPVDEASLAKFDAVIQSHL